MKNNTNQKNPPYLPFALPSISKMEIKEVVDTLESGWITLGPKTKKFEEQFRNFIGCKHAIAVSSCTAGLHLSLVAANIRAGDEVITTPFTFAATSHVIIHVGAKPVFADIDPNTFNIDIEKMEAAITPKTKAIIPVHIAGQPCKMDELMALAQKHKLLVFDDAAHALAATYEDRQIGNIGDASSFSFYATKNLTTGEGGMITTNNDEFAEKYRLLSLHGISKDAWKRYSAEGSWYYDVIYPGYKYNMSDIQASMGIWQLRRLHQFQQKRKEIARLYNEKFQEIPEIMTPFESPGTEHAWHLYIIRLNLEKLDIDRNRFIEEMRLNNIGTSVHFIPHHLHSYYQKNLGYKTGDFPVAEQVFERVVSLPLYPKMSFNDVERVTSVVSKIIKKYRKKI